MCMVLFLAINAYHKKFEKNETGTILKLKLSDSSLFCPLFYKIIRIESSEKAGKQVITFDKIEVGALDFTPSIK